MSKSKLPICNASVWLPITSKLITYLSAWFKSQLFYKWDWISLYLNSILFLPFCFFKATSVDIVFLVSNITILCNGACEEWTWCVHACMSEPGCGICVYQPAVCFMSVGGGLMLRGTSPAWMLGFPRITEHVYMQSSMQILTQLGLYSKYDFAV